MFALLKSTLVVAALLQLTVPAYATENPPIDRFEDEIRAFEAQDAIQPPPEHGTVFVGSSTFRLWTGLDKDFAQFHAINRGFGGSTLPEATHYAHRIVTKYHPDKIVVYDGTNDIAMGRSGKRVFQQFVDFVNEIRADMPDVDIYFISMSMPPSRVRWAHNYEVGNRLIKDYAMHTPHIHYIDVTREMLDEHGMPRDKLFIADKIHMTPEGQSIWRPIIERSLLEH